LQTGFRVIKERLAPITIGLAVSCVPMALTQAHAAETQTAAAVIQNGVNLGAESPSTQLQLTAWLNLHNRDALDARVQALYTPGSSTYRHWLTDADLVAYLPTSDEIATVQRALEAQHLKIDGIDPYNLSIRFEGRTSDVESAFHTQINRYMAKGEVVRVSSNQPQLAGAAAPLLHSLGGINSLKAKPFLLRAKDFTTGEEMKTLPVTQSTPTKLPYLNPCFYPEQTYTRSGPVFVNNRIEGVSLTVKGLTYGVTGPNTTGGTPSCAYSPKDVQGFYGMKTGYDMGYTGAGQTIVLVDAYLEPQAFADGNTFSRLSGLPQFTTSNFHAYNPYGANVTGFNSGLNWDEETDLDVQWAHAIAPGANIALVQAFSQDWEDLQAALLYAISNHLGNVISDSWGNPESYIGPLTADVFNEIAEVGAAEGVAIQFSSGDYGDFTQFGDPIAEASAPATSPYVTAVGGTTIAVNPADGTAYHLGWGNNINVMTTFPEGITDPPTGGSFYAGSGGGMSHYFAKPAYQATLPGNGRQVPDVSALADPFTGVDVVVSDSSGDQGVAVIGGTSLSSPIFSAMWAIMDQALNTSLGQAAPFVALLPSPLLRDVVPLTGPANTTAVETDPSGTTHYSADALSQPLFTTTEFVSTLWLPEDAVSVNLTFGTDSSLRVTQGWDNVTGWGTPDMGAIFSLLPSILSSLK
jgi:subtilase family serine protease